MVRKTTRRNDEHGTTGRPGRRLYDIKQASDVLGVSRWTVRRLIDEGALSVVTLPGLGDRPVRRVLIDIDRVALEQLIESSKHVENRS